MYSSNWATLNDFESEFLRIYWSDQRQEAAKYKLINTKYDSCKNLSMSEHFAEQYASVNALTIPFSERDLVNSIIRHFPLDIQKIWFTRTRTGEVSIRAASDFLMNIEENIRPKANTIAQNRNENHNYRGKYSSVREINYNAHRDGRSKISAIDGRTAYSNRGVSRDKHNYYPKGSIHGKSRFAALKWRAASKFGKGAEGE